MYQRFIMMLPLSRQQPLKWNNLNSQTTLFLAINMFRVRVNKIESIRDLDGNLGKRIELVEEREIPRFVVRPQSEEAKMVQEVLQAVQQQLPIFPARTEFAVPKIILFLTEQEYESLGIDFDVNQTYEIWLENQNIRFKKTA